MEINVIQGGLRQIKSDILVVDLFLEKKLSGTVKQLDDHLNGLIQKEMNDTGYKAKQGAVLLIRTDGLIASKYVLLIGLGDKKELNLEVLRSVSANVLSFVKQKKVKVVTSTIFGSIKSLKIDEIAQAMAEGVLLSNYTFGKYKKDEKKTIQTFSILVNSSSESKLASKGLLSGKVSSQGTIFARDLVNTPGQHMRPIELVNAAKEISKGKGSVKIKIYDKEKLKKMGAGGILGVSQGSDHDPYLVHLIYKPKAKAKKKVALVGKAVTFDSGGLSLKPAEYMTTMKCDMAGSAAVLGAFSVIDKIQPKAEVHAIFGACENMLSAKAIRPGDVLTTMNKKTVEVLNTDAEGRLTLADSLFYATKQKPDYIIDLATLTGACVVALGEEITGIMSNNDVLTEKIKTAAEAAGEEMWELPLYKKYNEQLKSDIADYKNIGGRYGGTLTAGLFLQNFVEKNAWAHLDIAGPAFASTPLNAYSQKGATGHGVRTLIEFLRQI